MAARDILKLLNNRRNRGEKVKSFQPGGRIEYVGDVPGLSPDFVQAFADYLNTPVEDRPDPGNSGIGGSYVYYENPEDAYQAAVESLTTQITGGAPQLYGTENISDADLRGSVTTQSILKDLGIEEYKDYEAPVVTDVIDTTGAEGGAGSGSNVKNTNFVDPTKGTQEVEYEVGTMGDIGSILKGASLIGDIGSLITAGDRQEETVKAFEDAADVAGDPSVVDPSARNLAYLQARGDDSERASTLATLIQQGVNPAQAAQIIQKQKDAALTQLINAEQSYQQQVFTAKERGRQRRLQFDMMATQAGLPIDYWGQAGQIVSKAGDLALGLEGLYNPAPEVKTDKKAQGGTFKTGGAFSHETNPLTLVTKDGEIAKDTKGRTMELTGQEYVVPENKVDAIQSLPPDEALKAYNRMFNEFDKQA